MDLNILYTWRKKPEDWKLCNIQKNLLIHIQTLINHSYVDKLADGKLK